MNVIMVKRKRCGIERKRKLWKIVCWSVFSSVLRIPVEIDISEILINWVKGILYVGKEKSERTRMKVATVRFFYVDG